MAETRKKKRKAGLRVVVRGDEPSRFMIPPKPRALGRWQRERRATIHLHENIYQRHMEVRESSLTALP